MDVSTVFGINPVALIIRGGPEKTGYDYFACFGFILS
jgi:hypothetical protein